MQIHVNQHTHAIMCIHTRTHTRGHTHNNTSTFILVNKFIKGVKMLPSYNFQIEYIRCYHKVVQACSSLIWLLFPIIVFIYTSGIIRM